MLPAWLLNYSVLGETLVPHFLGAADHPWLRVLLDEFERFEGRPERELLEHLRAPLWAPVGPSPGAPPAPAWCAAPERKLRLAIHVLRRLWERPRGATAGAVAPALDGEPPGPRGSRREPPGPRGSRREPPGPRGSRREPPGPRGSRLREALFARAAGSAQEPAAVVREVARDLGLEPAALEAALFADLPGERRLGRRPPGLGPVELGLEANLALAQGLLARATVVGLELAGDARALVRHARRRGLICTIRRPGGREDVRLEISGPLALFRRTLVYGRALGGLLPLLAWCRRFRLRAECWLGERPLWLSLGPGDPLAPAAAPPAYDSRLEERFAVDFRRLAPDWDVVHEPEPVAAGATFVFPDFALQDRRDPARRWLVEIAGFWTPEYVRRKLDALRAAGRRDLILCLDAERNCSAEELPPGAPVVRFRRRVDAATVLAIVTGGPPPGAGLPRAAPPGADPLLAAASRAGRSPERGD